MAEELETSRRFRLRAEEVRAIAEDVQDKSVKESLLKIAADYEKMATALVAIDNSNTMLRPFVRPEN